MVTFNNCFLLNKRQFNRISKKMLIGFSIVIFQSRIVTSSLWLFYPIVAVQCWRVYASWSSGSGMEPSPCKTFLSLSIILLSWQRYYLTNILKTWTPRSKGPLWIDCTFTRKFQPNSRCFLTVLSIVVVGSIAFA